MNDRLVRTRQRVATALGRSPSLAIGIARVCVALACFVECRFAHPGASGWRPECIFFAGYLAWAILCPAVAAASWKTNARAWPAILVVDWTVCIVMILLFEAYVLPVLVFSMLLLTAIQVRFGGAVMSIAGLALGAAFVLRGTVGSPDLPVSLPQSPATGLSIATVMIAAFVALSLASAQAYRNQLRNWGDELLMMGSNFRTLPVKLILERLSDLFEARQVGFLWTNGPGEAVNLAVHESGSTATIARVDDASAQLIDIAATDGAALFDPRTGALLCRDRAGHPAVVAAPGVTAQIAGAFAPGRGRTFPVRAGALVGRVYVMSGMPISEAVLVETERAADLTEDVFERYFFLTAWRARAVSEARHELGRDMHDSVLQTLAGMRMQIAAMMGDEDRQATDGRSRHLENLQEVIVAEQERLRHILDESYRTAQKPTDLVAQMRACVALLARQWDVECDLLTGESELFVDSDTAVEVEFLTREAVANAVQHAKARSLTLVLAIEGETLFLSLRNENRARRGRAGDGATARIGIDSQSLKRRLTSLGGAAYSDEVTSGSLLAIRIPLKGG